MFFWNRRVINLIVVASDHPIIEGSKLPELMIDLLVGHSVMSELLDWVEVAIRVDRVDHWESVLSETKR